MAKGRSEDSTVKMLHEVPPTAGLALTWADLAGCAREPDLSRALANYLGVESVGIACSGTAALIVALETLKRQNGRRTVVIPAYTCPLVPLAVAYVGLRVKLCDLSPNRFDLDSADLAAACDGDTLAVVPTHLCGMAANLEPVLEIAQRAGAFVVEDAAQALGATWHGRPVGTLGDVGIYSLSRGKGLTVYEGGFWVARSQELQAAIAETADRLLPFRAGVEFLRFLQVIGYRLFYNPIGLRFAYGLPLRRALARGDLVRAVGDEFRYEIPLHRMSSWRRRIGASALSRLPAAISANARRGRLRASRVREVPRITVVDELPDTTGTWPFLMILTELAEARDRVMERLWMEGLGVNRLFIHDLTGYKYLKAIVPNTEVCNARSFADRSFSVSNSEHLPENSFRRICDVIAREVVGSNTCSQLHSAG
jgi:dTDP-4-amino-4,6-dideoxygalactose transaminase